MRIGGCVCSMVRVCTDEVCVRSSTSAFSLSIKNVSCMSRAGWSGGKFRLSNTCQSSSISGPSAMVKPMEPKMDIISLRTSVSGWRVPHDTGVPVRVRSRSTSMSLSLLSKLSFNALMRSWASFFSSLIF